MDIADVSSTSIGTIVPSSGVRTEIATAHSCASVVCGALHPPPSQKRRKREKQGTERKRKRKTNIKILLVYFNKWRVNEHTKLSVSRSLPLHPFPRTKGHWYSMTSPTNIRTDKHDHESKPGYNPILTSGQVGRTGLTEEIDINIDMYISICTSTRIRLQSVVQERKQADILRHLAQGTEWRY